MTSPISNKSLNSFLVQEISSYFIEPFSLFSVSIVTENLEIFFTIATSQPSVFSNWYSLNLSNQFSEYSIFFKAPLQPLLHHRYPHFGPHSPPHPFLKYFLDLHKCSVEHNYHELMASEVFPLVNLEFVRRQLV